MGKLTIRFSYNVTSCVEHEGTQVDDVKRGAACWRRSITCRGGRRSRRAARATAATRACVAAAAARRPCRCNVCRRPAPVCRPAPAASGRGRARWRRAGRTPRAAARTPRWRACAGPHAAARCPCGWRGRVPRTPAPRAPGCACGSGRTARRGRTSASRAACRCRSAAGAPGAAAGRAPAAVAAAPSPARRVDAAASADARLRGRTGGRAVRWRSNTGRASTGRGTSR